MEYLKQARKSRQASREAVASRVAEMLERIRREGESAVRAFSRELDGWDPAQFRVSDEEIRAARQRLPQSVIEDIDFCQRQVRRFAEAQRDSLRPFEIETEPGVVLGQTLIPIANVGAYIPGGRYPLVASAHMSILTAKVAGVDRVVACTPPARDGIYPATLYAMAAAGADEIYCLGGVQALGAMVYGTSEIAPVDFLVGPGNAYVAEAKRQLFGEVGIDLLAGPTEIMVIADESADPVIVAGDLLGQAEHGPDSPAVLITRSRDLGNAVIAEASRQLETLPTAEVARAAWNDLGEVIYAESDEEAVALANDWAPEHLEVQTRHLDWYQARLKNYGSLFLGEHSTVAHGDKTIGTNHILPTGRAARYTGGLWVGKFLKTVTYQRVDRRGGELIGPVCSRQCRLEGMEAHAVSVDLRLEKYARR
ncbi:MAG: histidinol dehydrogenase [Dehalococcoidia bacterium]|nr:MAG: histidinol dehydrogenase [Dehalococcoidia bacterium]